MKTDTKDKPVTRKVEEEDINIEDISKEDILQIIEEQKDEFGDLYGLPVITINAEQYAIAIDDGVAYDACTEYIKESLWAFTARFLAAQTNIDKKVFEALVPLCESANEAIKCLISDTCGLEKFVDNAIFDEGKGAYLGFYDSNEIELDGGMLAYRIN